MEGIAAVTQRIGQIQGMLASLAPPAAVRPSGAPAASAADFATALARASAPGGTPQLGAPAVAGTAATSTARLPDGTPAVLAAYGNGKIPASALTSLGQGNHRLWAPAAEGYKALQEAAAKDGIRIGLTDSYRSYDEQVDLARRKGLYSEGGLAAKPGTSDHGWGMSVDLALDNRAQAWMRTNASRFGFEEDVPREPWHWTYTAGA